MRPLNVTLDEIERDLAALSPEECRARGIKHSSQDDHSTAIVTGDRFVTRYGILRYSARKSLGLVGT